MMRSDAKLKKVYLYPKLLDFRRSIGGLWGFRTNFQMC